MGQRGRVGPKTRFLDNVENNMGMIGIREWRQKILDKDVWKQILEEAYSGL